MDSYIFINLLTTINAVFYNSLQNDPVHHSYRLTKDGGIAWTSHPVSEVADSASQNVEYQLNGIQFWSSSW